MQQSECKGCRDSYRITESRIAKMLASDAFSKMECVSDERYAKRLEACNSCSSLLNGNTCTICGCIVQITAKMAAKDCPHAAGSRWA
ncbi:hypothetical protein AB6A23_07400 [Paenibacillus tarimensis]